MRYTLKEKVEAAREMVKTFRLERISFLIIAVISIILLMGVAVYAYLCGSLSWKVLSTLFPPAGGIAYSAQLILGMYRRALDFLKEELK